MPRAWGCRAQVAQTCLRWGTTLVQRADENLGGYRWPFRSWSDPPSGMFLSQSRMAPSERAIRFAQVGCGSFADQNFDNSPHQFADMKSRNTLPKPQEQSEIWRTSL